MSATVKAFMATYEEGSAQNDASIINRVSTPDCTRQFLPKSVRDAFNLPDDFYFDNAGMQMAFEKDLTVVSFHDGIISNLVIDTETRRAAYTTITTIHTKAGESYTYEVAWTLYLNDDGSKVKKAIEFCDKEVLLRMMKDYA
jgi:hypothetical protein